MADLEGPPNKRAKLSVPISTPSNERTGNYNFKQAILRSIYLGFLIDKLLFKFTKGLKSNMFELGLQNKQELRNVLIMMTYNSCNYNMGLSFNSQTQLSSYIVLEKLLKKRKVGF